MCAIFKLCALCLVKIHTAQRKSGVRLVGVLPNNFLVPCSTLYHPNSPLIRAVWHTEEHPTQTLHVPPKNCTHLLMFGRGRYYCLELLFFWFFSYLIHSATLAVLFLAVSFFADDLFTMSFFLGDVFCTIDLFDNNFIVEIFFAIIISLLY